MTFVRSCGRTRTITSSTPPRPRALPGIQVFTAADLDLRSIPPPPFIRVDERMFRPLMASDKVRFVGDIVAAVLSRVPRGAVDAAELVRSTTSRCRPSPTSARRSGRGPAVRARRHQHLPAIPPREADENLFDACDVVITGSHVSQRLPALPIEPRSTSREFEDGRLTDPAVHPDPASGQDGPRRDARAGARARSA